MRILLSRHFLVALVGKLDPGNISSLYFVEIGHYVLDDVLLSTARKTKLLHFIPKCSNQRFI